MIFLSLAIKFSFILKMSSPVQDKTEIVEEEMHSEEIYSPEKTRVDGEQKQVPSPKYKSKKNIQPEEESFQIHPRQCQANSSVDHHSDVIQNQILPPTSNNQRCLCWEDFKVKLHNHKNKIIAITVVFVILSIIGVLLGIYLKRSPEVVNVSEPILINYKQNWEEIQRYFFNISGLTYTGRKNQGRGSASIVQTSSTYNQRLFQTMPNYPSQQNSGNYENTYRHYGYIDLFAEYQGVTVRGMNPENRIYYVDYSTLLESSAKIQTKTSRLLTAQNSQRMLTEIEGYFTEILAKKIAELEGVALDRIIVKKEEVWVGTLNAATGTYTISTAPKTTTTTNASLTADQKKAAAQALYDNVLKAAIEEKKNQLQDYGAVIADYFGFSFDRYTDLYITYEQATTLGSDSDDDEVTDETNSTNSTKRLTPRRPIIISKVYEPVYGNRPARLKEGKTISQKTYEEMLACIDFNETTRVCSVEEWLDLDSPNKISSGSLANQKNLDYRTRYRVSVKPLPADQVKQQPYETFDPEEMYSHHDSGDSSGAMQSYPASSSSANLNSGS